MILSSQKVNLNHEFLDIENKKLWKIVLMSLREETEKVTKDETFEHARKPNNKSRNRYRDVLPYDSTRVKLLDFEGSDYINANYVNLEGNKYGRRYILTQGPLGSTVSHFWRMVWDENSKCIVMLNKVIEKDTVKCAQYFPETENETYDYPEIGMSVSLLDSEVNKIYVKRILNLHNEKTNEIRKIVQFHYQSWPDFGVPNSAELFLKFLWDVRDSGGLMDPSKPAIIHCSAGIGRSGTFVLIDLSLLQIEEDQSCQIVDLQQTLIHLRKCRVGLIQTAEQLRFAYLSVIAGAKSLLKLENTGSELIECSENIVDLKSIELLSDSDGDTDLELSENSDDDLALDKAANAVRTRRGLPPSKKIESSIDYSSQNSYRTKEDGKPILTNTSDVSNVAKSDKKILREIRRNRTNQLIEDIRLNMRRKNLERDRLMFKLGLKRLANYLTRQSRTTFILGASTIVGMLSVTCGYILYKYIG